MASSYSTSFRLNYQAPGDNLNVWGTTLNTAVFQLLEDAVAKPVTFALSGTKVLTSVNGATDEARCGWLNVTSGTGGTVTIPSVNKTYGVVNAASGDVIISTGAGTTATFKAGERGTCFCDGTNVYRPYIRDFGALEALNAADPTSATSLATKNYVDAQAWAVSTGSLPAQSGANGKFLTTNGTTPSWASVYPSQTGNSGKFLSTDGTNTSWSVVTSVGDIVYSTYTRSAPDYLPCDGSIYLKSSYSALNAVLSDPYVEGSVVRGGTLQDGLTTANRYIAYGNGTFVAIADGSYTGSTSSNGTTWTARSVPVAAASSLKYNNTLFMATASGAASALSTSADGITWNTRTLPSSANWTATAYGGGVYVAVSDSTAAATSTDGITWTARTIGGGGSVMDIAYGNGIFVKVGGGIETSPNGITWTAQTYPPLASSSKPYLAFGNGYFVLTSNATGGATNSIFYSTDGAKWWPASQGSYNSYSRVIFANGLFFLLSSAGTVVQASSTPWGWQDNIANGQSYGTLVSCAYDGTRLITIGQTDPFYAYVNTIGPSTSYLRAPVAPLQFGQRAYVKAQ